MISSNFVPMREITGMLTEQDMKEIEGILKYASLEQLARIVQMCNKQRSTTAMNNSYYSYGDLGSISNRR